MVRRALRECRARRRVVVTWVAEDGLPDREQWFCQEIALDFYVHIGEHVHGGGRRGTVRIGWRICFRH